MSSPVQAPARRALSLKLNPAGYMAAAGAVYAGVVMLYNASHHHGVISVPVIVAALAAAASLYTRTAVTPVADPRDGSGAPLIPAPPVTVQVAVTPPYPPPPVPESAYPPEGDDEGPQVPSG